MNISFADSFGKSLKRLVWHQHPIYKVYELFRYKIPMFFKNLWFFRKELWEFRSWDYSFNLMMLRRSLEKTVNTIEYYGQEIDESRMKKVQKIKRVIELLDHVRSDSYIEMAEKELGEVKYIDWDFEPMKDNPELYQLVDNHTEDEAQHNRKVYKLADEIESQEWDELFSILKGQNIKEYSELYNSLTDNNKKANFWVEWFDGSGMKHWWD
jgi:hypothetical protein